MDNLIAARLRWDSPFRPLWQGNRVIVFTMQLCIPPMDHAYGVE
jgi:hypothetical protein